MEWFALILPILTIFIAFILYRKDIEWYEAFIPLLSVIITILIFKSIAIYYNKTFDEYWTTYVTEIRYYEPWDEYIQQTCTRSYACGKDSNGNTIYCEEPYDCSYVKYHSPRWIKISNINKSYNISKNEYFQLFDKFGDSSKFVDMNRDYYKHDGDMFYSKWLGSDSTLEAISTKHRYENRIKASVNNFNYIDLSKEDVIQYQLYEYPVVKNLKQKHILGVDDPDLERKLEIINAKLGHSKQVKIFILFFDNLTNAQMQEQYWKGGNKNELIICLPKNNREKWSHIISWNKNPILNINIRNYIAKKDDLNLYEFMNYIENEVKLNFERREFSEFSYLKIELSKNQTIYLWIIAILISIASGIFIVINQR